MNCPKRTYSVNLYRLLLLLVVALISLPCPAKRELKQIMDIPVSEATHNKPNEDQLNACSTYTVINQKIQADKFDSSLGSGLLPEVFLISPALAEVGNDLVSLVPFSIESSVPLFILHQQYRL